MSWQRVDNIRAFGNSRVIGAYNNQTNNYYGETKAVEFRKSNYEDFRADIPELPAASQFYLDEIPAALQTNPRPVCCCVIFNTARVNSIIARDLAGRRLAQWDGAVCFVTLRDEYPLYDALCDLIDQFLEYHNPISEEMRPAVEPFQKNHKLFSNKERLWKALTTLQASKTVKGAIFIIDGMERLERGDRIWLQEKISHLATSAPNSSSGNSDAPQKPTFVLTYPYEQLSHLLPSSFHDIAKNLYGSELTRLLRPFGESFEIDESSREYEKAREIKFILELAGGTGRSPEDVALLQGQHEIFDTFACYTPVMLNYIAYVVQQKR